MTDRIDPDAPADDTVDGVLKDLAGTVDDATGTVRFGVIVETLGARGYGPLLFILAAMMLLPIAAIPFVPAAIGVAVAAVGVQLMRGGQGVWLPGRLRRIEVPRDKLGASLDRIDAGLDRLRPFLAARMTRLVDRYTAQAAIGAVLCVIGIVVAVLGVTPFLPLVLSLPVLFFGIALMARDGLFVVLGFAWLLPATGLCWWLVQGVI